MAIRIGREALTRDVDAVQPSDREFTDVVHFIAARRGWSLHWLNDAVKGFVSHFDSADAENYLVTPGWARMDATTSLHSGSE